ncbi:MAG: ABC transporter permease [Myxococcota bacterium]|nr:ABC transporter permease [Myxococcota bacterium]
MSTYNPIAFLQVGWKHRRLIARLARRKIEARYRGSVLGFLWTTAHPLLMLTVYTFVFSFVLGARWDLASESRVEFALFLFSGMILYAIFAECVNEAPDILLSYRTYIKQVLFPVEVLGWVSLLAALSNFLISLSVLFVFYVVVQGQPLLTWAYLPLVVLPIVLFTLGTCWFLSSLGVFLRDISQVVGVFTLALLFLSPIFYPLSRIPEPLHRYFLLNPFATIIETSKDALFYGGVPDWRALLALSLAGWVVAWLGYAWFMKTRSGFADVL